LNLKRSKSGEGTPNHMSKSIVKKAIHATAFLNEPIECNKSFSRGIKITFGGMNILFISGTASINKKGKTYYAEDFLAQTKRTFDNISALLSSEGARWADIVQTRCYLKNIERDYAMFNAHRNRFYKKQKLCPFPASVCISANLCRPELLVEIEAIAVIKAQKRKSKIPIHLSQPNPA